MIPDTVDVACNNGPDSCTISGPPQDVEKVVNELISKKIFCKLVNVANIAYHSRYIQPAGPIFLNHIKSLIPDPQPRSPRWVSTSIPESKWRTDLAKFSSAEYHVNNLCSPVLFEEAAKHVPKGAVLIEIAPHGLLQAVLKRSSKSGCTNISLAHRMSNDNLNYFLSALGKLVPF